MRLFDLSGKVALVTGGNGGIGLGMARGLAEAGAAIALAGRSESKGNEAAAVLAGLGVRSAFLQGDVADAAACDRIVQQAIASFGRLDILVNNAGTNVRKRPEQYTPAEWRQVIDTNLSSAFFCSQSAYPAMKQAGGGKIINIGSMMSIFGASHVSAYGASKGGMVQLTKSLAVAWAADKIQVNAVLPGWIETDLTDAARRELPGLNERVLARTPAARWGAPADLAGIAVFLAAAASDFITGAAIPVDGGFSSQG